MAGKNIVVSGLQNAGKTAIRALANEFHPAERFATIEREYERTCTNSRAPHPVVAMEAREGSAELTPRGGGLGR